ncbi:MAG: hypothetical protein JSW39_30550 [Desulfobacterales bacterium]|nr:MAG: hypothetical protein JSW39_30550 [Desulfobacterales bacterium]
MKANFFWIAVFFPLLLVFVDPASAADVAQGKCIVFDTVGKRIILEEYGTEISPDHPYGKSTGLVSVFDFAQATIGITPEPGDILRIAFSAEGGVKRALKVMNVSKQDLRKK